MSLNTLEVSEHLKDFKFEKKNIAFRCSMYQQDNQIISHMIRTANVSKISSYSP